VTDQGASGRWHRYAASLANRNFRLYLAGHGVSQVGSFMQLTAELWAIVELTHSGTAVGAHAVLRFVPLVLFGLYGGVMSDRMNRRKLLLLTQGAHAASALTLAVAWGLGQRSLALIYAVVLAQGLVNAVDNPLRRSFIRDMVADAELTNAVGLEGAVSTVARTIGPAVAGVVIASLGVGWCFNVNAVSFAAVLASIFLIDPRALRPAVLVTRSGGQIREAMRYAWHSPPIRRTLLLIAVVSAFGWNWHTLLPLYASEDLSGDAALFGLLVSMLSVGALVGAFVTVRMSRPGLHHLQAGCLMLSVALSLAAVAPGVEVAIAAVMLLGLAGTMVNITSQTRLQLIVTDAMTGRLMALYSICWLGTRPIGGLVGGWLTDSVGARGAFLFGAGVIALTTVLVSVHRRRNR
jgi:MFS family permease